MNARTTRREMPDGNHLQMTDDTHERIDVVSLRDDGRSYQLLLRRSDHLSESIRRLERPYEFPLLRMSRALLSPGDIVVDVGANIGNHTLYWSEVADANVVAFEPYPPALKILRRNVELNAAGARVQIHPLAVGSTAGCAAMELSDSSNIGSARAVPASAGEITVTTLDGEVGPTKLVRLLKIDVEGSELSVLRGATRVLLQRPALILEAHTLEQRRLLDEFLRPLGYRRLPISVADSPTFFYLTAPRELIGLLRSAAFWEAAAGAVIRRLHRWLRPATRRTAERA
jgi:FkbM family methyltransferase